MVLTFDSLEEVLAFTQKITGIAKEEPAKKKAEPKAEPDPEPEVENETEETTYSLMDVRAVLAEVKKKSGSAALKNLLDSFGAAKLSDVKPEDYADLIKKAGEL